MLDKSMLGTRYVCFECGCKFYDLNRAEPLCPDCGADQRQAPVRDLRALLASAGRISLPEPAVIKEKEKEKDGDKDDDQDLLGADSDVDEDDE